MKHFNLPHNVLVNFCLSLEVSSAKRETGHDLQYNKLCIQAASQGVERLNTWELRKLKNDSESLKLFGDTDQSPASLAEIYIWHQWLKFIQKEISKFSGLVQFCLMSLLFAKYFAQNYLKKQILANNFSRPTSDINILTILQNSKPFSSL